MGNGNMFIGALNLSLMTAVCLVSQIGKSSGTTVPRNPQASIATLDGEYLLGDGFVNQNLKVNPDGWFSFVWATDDGGYHRDEGTADIVDGALILHAVWSGTNRGPGPFPHPKHLPVRWGKRLYLLPDREVLRFCNAVNLGLEPKDSMYGRFYLRMVMTDKVKRGEEEATLERAEGLPALPAQWGPFLLKRPLRGQVTDVLKDGRATIDLGSREGLRESMELLVEEEPHGDGPAAGRNYGLAKVVAVEAYRCTAEVKHPGLFHGFRKGQRASSKTPKEIIESESTSFFW